MFYIQVSITPRSDSKIEDFGVVNKVDFTPILRVQFETKYFVATIKSLEDLAA
jgi:hypothetical protein